MREDSSNKMQSRVTSCLTWSWKCHMLFAKVSQADQRPTLDDICGPWHEEPPNLSLHLSISTCTTSKVYHIQYRVLIFSPFPTHTHEKLNSLRWEIILNATTWLAITTVDQSRVVIFVYSTFEKALWCAHLVNQNLLYPIKRLSFIQSTGLLIGACKPGLNVRLIHCSPQVSYILEIYVLTFF